MAEKTQSSLVKDLVEAGIHFGQRSSNWNPKMGPYIYGKRNQIHIIDLRETVKGLLLAKKFVAKTVADGKDVCFVGTKRQAREVIRQRATDVKMHWVIERWLGGTLTNFRTIRSRLKRLVELERIEESGELATSYSKKMESQLRREKRKILRNLEGIRNMNKLPGAIVAVDVRREMNALLEARKLGIPTICLIDTDGDPDLVDIPIPGNDDSMRSIDVIVRELCEAVVEGKNQRMVAVREDTSESGEGKEGGGSGGGRSRRERGRGGASAGSGDEGAGDRQVTRRSRRSQYRADAGLSAGATDAGGSADDAAGSDAAPSKGKDEAAGNGNAEPVASAATTGSEAAATTAPPQQD
ncbi:MAG: 30S ribosomal protein S2 [Planctomycetes bacterium]|nr:30S ribosomal protein S2 [Planctomycetota bacterium]NOG55808.1 30S ribosomal protein S2 [Planctomycetota bacterium]